MENLVSVFRKISLLLSAILAITFFSTAIIASQSAFIPPKNEWKHRSIFGTFDRAAAQRGLQVYTEICSTCHSLGLLSYRNLEALGFSEAEATAIASHYSLMDGPNDQGEMFERAAIASDRFIGPYANNNAARTANNGALPPDLSLIVKARPHGEDYIYALLTGYEAPPENVTLPVGMYWNKYFPGHQIAMPPPLHEDGVTFSDGTKASVEQQAHDISVFLTWAADPHLEDRMAMGLKSILYLIVFAILMYFVKRKIWSNIKK